MSVAKTLRKRNANVLFLREPRRFLRSRNVGAVNSHRFWLRPKAALRKHGTDVLRYLIFANKLSRRRTAVSSERVKFFILPASRGNERVIVSGQD